MLDDAYGLALLQELLLAYNNISSNDLPLLHIAIDNAQGSDHEQHLDESEIDNETIGVIDEPMLFESNLEVDNTRSYEFGPIDDEQLALVFEGKQMPMEFQATTLVNDLAIGFELVLRAAINDEKEEELRPLDNKNSKYVLKDELREVQEMKLINDFVLGIEYHVESGYKKALCIFFSDHKMVRHVLWNFKKQKRNMLFCKMVECGGLVGFEEGIRTSWLHRNL
ncbi:hypothetical protein SLE2022_259690 [Rubroshorea leprosula]